MCFLFFFMDTATTEIYTALHPLSLHGALPIYGAVARWLCLRAHLADIRTCLRLREVHRAGPLASDHLREVGLLLLLARVVVEQVDGALGEERGQRSEEHTSELQSLMRISYAVFCLKKKKTTSTLHSSLH